MRIAVAMSGGMDSTAAALLLREQGHEVAGFHMLLHDLSESARRKALDAANAIGVPLFTLDLRREFEELVVSPFVSEYAAGRTPSPCPLCNRWIKMTHLFREAWRQGFEKLATGHYARIEDGPGGPFLLKGLDTKKDQSYFLFRLTRDILERTLFPLGRLTKGAVREMLRSRGLDVWESEESQELCFVPGDDYRRFLRERGVRSDPGPIYDLDGNLLGSHRGIVNYTVGQRRGLGICGPRPLYVVRIDAAGNALHVGSREDTLVRTVSLTDMNILTGIPLNSGDRFRIKVRSTSKEVPCTVASISSDSITVEFEEPQSGVAAGQAGVIYSGDRVAGGGWIGATEQ